MDVIKVITGLRRSGKLTIMRQVQEYYKTLGVSSQQLLYYNFESYEYVHLLDDQKLYTYRKDRIRNIKDSVYLFFDEIQNVKNWQRCINALQVDFLCDIYITGSNAKLLSGNWQLILQEGSLKLRFFLFLLRNSLQLKRIRELKKNHGFCFRNTYSMEECLLFVIWMIKKNSMTIWVVYSRSLF